MKETANRGGLCHHRDVARRALEVWAILGGNDLETRREAAILFGLAKATKDPKISAALMEKAADVKLKVDVAGSPPDLTPLAPDIEPPPG